MAKAKGKPIVVSIDGSAQSWEAMENALTLAHLLDRPVDVLTVIQLRKAGYFAFIDRHLKEDQQAYAQKILAEAEERGKKAEVQVRPHRLESEKDISEAIINYLEGAGPVKFLVLGAHGHGFVGRHLLGSVTERVIREVARRGLPVPVLVVPSSAPEEDLGAAPLQLPPRPA
ncbi:MAG TPA: universal stress protein [Desulfobaccales bacterium]|nr:universal stress protein [Desulfobaccales bacterium]